MPWFKVDDALATHDKVLAAGNAAMGLWVRAGAWSAQHLTDGFVPLHAVKLLGNVGQARALVTAGLWVEADKGYRFHEWHDYQPTREKVEADRREARDRMQRLRKGKKGSAEVRANNGERSAEVRNPEVRDPVPSRPLSVVQPSSQSSSVAREVDEDGLTRIQQALNNCPKTHARKTADFILAKAPGDVKRPVSYVLKAIEDEPALYAYRRGNPTRADECEIHAGEWADACRACAIDARLGGTA